MVIKNDEEWEPIRIEWQRGWRSITMVGVTAAQDGDDDNVNCYQT